MNSTQTVLAVIGLLLGVVVLLVVIWLLNDVLRPLRRISADITEANKAPMLKKGIPGADQLSTTRRLAESVPPLAEAYLNKLGASPAPPPPAAPAAAAPAPAAASAPAPAASPSGADSHSDSTLPAWKLFSR
jgi:hypothetical protein